MRIFATFWFRNDLLLGNFRMKTNSMITLERDGKIIILYIDGLSWGLVPELSWIVDVEVIDKHNLNEISQPVLL